MLLDEPLSDKRSPVLYLRAFRHDTLSSKIIGLPFTNTLADTTEEEQIAKVMNEIGPFIAIGRPGEERKLLGATRIYVDDKE